MKNRFLYIAVVAFVLAGMVLGATPIPVRAHYADYSQGMKQFMSMLDATGNGIHSGCYSDLHSTNNLCYIVRSYDAGWEPLRVSYFDVSATSYQPAGEGYGRNR